MWSEFWDALFVAHPDFVEQDDGAILIHPARRLTLSVRTSDAEITLAIDEWDWHWRTSAGLTSNALAIIDGILTETQVFERVERGTQLIHNSLGSAIAPLRCDPGCTITVRSWHGTHDRIVRSI